MTQEKPFSIRYAIPRGGSHDFSFATAEQLAEHVQANAPGMFAGVPQLDSKYEENIMKQCRRMYRLPDDKKKV